MNKKSWPSSTTVQIRLTEPVREAIGNFIPEVLNFLTITVIYAKLHISEEQIIG